MPMRHPTPDLQLAHERMIGDLRDLVVALDRCVPRARREAKRQFARDAAALKETALAWLQVLRDAGSAAR